MAEGERGRKVSGEEDAYQPYLQEERRYAAKGLISFQFSEIEFDMKMCAV